MMFPAKVNLSTIAAHSRGSVKIFVHPENDSFEAIATLRLCQPDQALPIIRV
jgi:hypothetical protein